MPFAQEIKAIKPRTIVQEDGAPAYITKENRRIWLDFGVTKLLWPGNSPDLNIIEPT